MSVLEINSDPERSIITSYLYRAFFPSRAAQKVDQQNDSHFTAKQRQVAQTAAELEEDPDLWILQLISAYLIPCNKSPISKS